MSPSLKHRPRRVRLQVLVPVHAPDHPAKVVPDSGAGVKTTAVPLGKLAVHFPGQSIPAGVLITLPAKPPMLSTVSVGACLEGCSDGCCRFQRNGAGGARAAAGAGPPCKYGAGFGSRFQRDGCPLAKRPAARAPAAHIGGTDGDCSRAVPCGLHRELDGSGGTGNARYPA